MYLQYYMFGTTTHILQLDFFLGDIVLPSPIGDGFIVSPGIQGWFVSGPEYVTRVSVIDVVALFCLCESSRVVSWFHPAVLFTIAACFPLSFADCVPRCDGRRPCRRRHQQDLHRPLPSRRLGPEGSRARTALPVRKKGFRHGGACHNYFALVILIN